MRFFIILGLFLLSAESMQAQSIQGKIVNQQGETVVGAIIMVEGTTKGAASDVFGSYSISGLSNGTYSIEIKALSYATQKITGVVVGAEVVKLDVVLKTDAFEGNVIEIKDVRQTNSEASVIMEIREAKGVVSGVGAV
ncbi:MAG: carboxypeptidase-like regulatory domain-containing protein, partial [Bacteroidota bacterium]